jgi:hypothetical protein
MQSTAKTVDEYLAGLPEDRKEHMLRVRDMILQNLPEGYEEGMLWGGITYYIPLDVFPDTYNKQPLAYVSLVSQKNYMSIYLLCVYGADEDEFRQAYEATGKKLDMGKSCIRFKDADDLALGLIGERISKYTPEQYIEHYKKARGNR